MALILSPAGCVCDIAQSNQFDNVQGEAQTLCGPWTVAALKYAGLPGKGALASGAGHENPIDDFAEVEFTKYIGPNVTSNQMGSSIENMHQFFHDAGNLHYFDIDSINDSSQQADDNDRIRRAVQAGYPLAVTVHEPSVISKRLGRCPYSWQPALGDITHVIPVIGVDKDGDFIVGDQANVVEGWPQTYLASQLHIHWASVVQLVGPDAAHPWLAPIPGNDPRTWPQGFNAQVFAQSQPQPQPQERTTWMTSGQEHQAALTWAIGHQIVPLLFAGKDVPADNSGIKNDWVHRYMNGLNLGYAVTPETPYVGWDDKPILAVWWSNGYRTEWDGAAHVYDQKNQRLA